MLDFVDSSLVCQVDKRNKLHGGRKGHAIANCLATDGISYVVVQPLVGKDNAFSVPSLDIVYIPTNLPDGYEWTGEHRQVRAGEYYIANRDSSEVRFRYDDPPYESVYILKKVRPPYPNLSNYPMYEFTGEYRRPKQGEYYWSPCGRYPAFARPIECLVDHPEYCNDRFILRKKPYLVARDVPSGVMVRLAESVVYARKNPDGSFNLPSYYKCIAER
jgi:hypothetical protein